MRSKILVLSFLLGILAVLGLAGSLPVTPVHAASTWPLLLDANNTGATDACPGITTSIPPCSTTTASPVKTFNLGLIIEANNSIPLNGVVGWQVGVIYDNTTVVPQGDPTPSSPGDGAANTITFGGMTASGQVNWAGMIAAGHAFGGSNLADPKIDNHHNEIIVFLTIFLGNPSANIGPMPSSTVLGNLLASITFEVIKPAATLPLSLDAANLEFVGPGVPPPVIPGIVPGGPVSESLANSPPIASFTVTPLPVGDSACIPVTGVVCSPYAIKFDGSASSDSDGTIASPTGYFWDFGDGTQDNVNNPSCGLVNCNQGQVAVHDYGAATKTNASLRVVDNQGATGSSRDALGALILNLQSSHTYRAVTPGYDPTTTGLTCNPSPVATGTSSSCLATVTDSASSGATVPTGTVDFTSNSTGTFTTTPCTLAPLSLVSASCSVSYNPSILGSHHIKATYSGDSSHLDSSGSFDLTAIAHPTTTSVTCDSPVVLNQASTCTATTTDTTTSPSAPTGTITFTHTGTSSGSFNSTTCTLQSPTSSSASCQVKFYSSTVGTANIGSSYPGDSTHSASSGSPFIITVNPRSTSTTISCTSPVFLSQSSACTATVTDSSSGGTAVTPGGTVSFTATGLTGSFDQDTCTLVAGSLGTATCTVNFTATAVGTASISATYSPSESTHNGSTTASPASVVVNTPPPGFTITSVTCASPVLVNQPSVCTGTVTDIGSSPTTPAGTVAFTSTGSASGSFGSTTPCTLSPGTSVGTATCTANFVPSNTGSASISASYTPSDSHTASSSSTPASITVNRRATSASVACSSPIDTNSVSSCTVTVTDTSPGTALTPSGTVTFSSNSTGTFSSMSCSLSGSGSSATCSITYTPTLHGSHGVTATYPGDSSHVTSSALFTVVAKPLPPALTVTGPSSANTGTTVTLSLSSSGVGGSSVKSLVVTWGDGKMDSLSTTSTIATHTYATPGSYNVTITATDDGGLMTVKNLQIQVTTPSGLDLTLVLVAVVAAIVVAGIIFYVMRRRRKPALKPPAMTTGPDRKQ